MRSYFFIVLAVLLCSVTNALAAGNGATLEKKFSSHFSSFYDFTQDRRGVIPMTLADETGKTFTLDSYKGKIVILHFWAMWCPPCVRELPKLKAFRDKAEGPGLAIVPVSLDYGAEAKQIGDFMKKHDVAGLPIITVPRDDKAWSDLTSFALPVTFIINEKGRILYKMTGDNDWTARDTVNFMDFLLNQKK